MRNWFVGLIVGFCLLFGHMAKAEVVKTPYSQAQLLSVSQDLVPGTSFHMALELTLKPHWHSYWLNPGDAGEPTDIQWDLPKGISIGPIQWPAPHLIPLGELANYGYEGTTVYPVTVTVAKDFQGFGPRQITAHAHWLVCEDICVPDQADLTITLTAKPEGVTPNVDNKGKAAIDAALAELPRTVPASDLQAAFVFADGQSKFSFAGQLARKLAQSGDALFFFPEDSGAVKHPAPQKLSSGPDGFTLWTKPGFRAERGKLKIDRGILVAGEGKSRQSFAIQLQDNGSALPGTGADTPPVAKPALKSSLGLWQAILFAFLGGMILNLMPCVFPVLSMKVLGFVNASQAEHDEHRKQGMLFGAGVLASFWVLAGVLLVLKSGGAQIGWGFQLQSPVFVTAMAALFFVIGLNLAGLFEIGGSWTSAGSSLTEKGGMAGAFFTGVLAVLVASPCTAPAMGAALGFTLGQGAIVTLAVFTALGAGFALPFVLLSFFPAWLKVLPKPGPWMGRFHQFLAFPMFAAALWLVWVLGGIGGMIAMAAAATGLLALAFAIWAFKGGWLGKALAALGVIAAIWAFHSAVVERSTEALAPEPWSVAQVAELQAKDRIIFVDFTADWCLTCQFNKKTSLSTAQVADAFKKHNVAYLEADWTKRDANIAQELAKHGRAGVPMYLVYLPGQKDPVLLPELLTPRIVVDAVSHSGQ